MKKHFQYLMYMIRHKFWVTYYCFRDGLIWRGLKHDASKFLPSEWLPYANHFCGSGKDKRRAIRKEAVGYCKPYKTGDEKFNFAWLLHQKRNDHHWQWWILPEDDGGFIAMPMKKKALREMICDWRGAGKAQGHGDNTPTWYKKNKGKMTLHPDTKKEVELRLISIYGIESMVGALSYDI